MTGAVTTAAPAVKPAVNVPVKPSSGGTSRAILGPESVRFRGRIVDALERIDRARFWYIDQDTCAGVCPICDGILSVYFAGTAPRAEVICRRGCREREVADALARLVPRAAA
jgi:hypothetical protein